MQKLDIHNEKRPYVLDFPGGREDRNPSANAGHMSSIPVPGRFHMPQSNWADGPQLLNPMRLEPVLSEERNPLQLDSPQAIMKTQCSQK